MALSDLIKSRSSSTSLEGPSAAPGVPSFPPVEPARAALTDTEGPSSEEPRDTPAETGSPGGASTSSSSPSLDPKPYGVVEVTTPSGLGIYYQAGPKRLYRLRHATKTKVTEEEVPSMSEVLGILEKGGLPWWGMKIGAQGVAQLLERGCLIFDTNREDPCFVHTHGEDGHRILYEDITSTDGLVDLLKKHKLTVNDVRDSAGDRGQTVHDALESWAEKGIMPVPEVYAAEEQGYVAGLRDFLIESGVEAIDSEVMVGSWKHKFAGRFDLRGLIPNGAEVVVKTYPKRKPKREKIAGGRWLLDLKTSKSVYVTHFLQLEGYEGASVECGYEPTDHRGVIHVTEDGRYELVESTKTYADFLAIRKAYDAVQK